MSPEPQHAPCWESIDGIVLINLDRCPDRWEHFLNTAGAHLPADRLHRLSAVEGVKLADYGKEPWFTARTGERSRFWGGTAGCALSHRRAVGMAKERGWRHMLVLEDDAAMAEVTEAHSRVLARALRQLEGPYMLYLGYNRPLPWGRRLQGEGEVALWRIEGVLATHAYLIPAAMYDLLLSQLPTEGNIWEWLSLNRAVDTFYRDIIADVMGVPIYTILPHLFHQAGMESSITPGSSVGESSRGDGLPLPLCSFQGRFHRLLSPFHRLKIRLNSVRTHHRALNGGLPGYRKSRPDAE